MYTIEPIARKGRGCVAARKITRGTLIEREIPVLVRDVAVRDLEMREVEEIFLESDEERIEIEKDKVEYRNVVDAFLKLPSNYKTDYLDLKYEENYKTDLAVFEAYEAFSHCDITFDMFAKVCSVYKTNTFHNGVCLKLSMFNHSCWPNAECFWNEEVSCRFLVALEDIAQGEEICHSYLQRCSLSENRRKTLAKKWNFDCDCRLCCLEDNQDKRAKFIQIENALFNKTWSDEICATLALQLAREVKGLRVFTLLKMLDVVFKESVGRICFLNKTDRLNLHDVTSLGLDYSVLIFGKDHKTSKMWQVRVSHPGICIFKQKLLEGLQNFLFVATCSLILWNFWNGDCSLYFLLLIAFLFHQKM